MTAARPLMQLGIGELEALFEKQGKHIATLAGLKHELSFRQVPRATTLLERILKAEAALDPGDGQMHSPPAPRATLQLKPRSPTARPVPQAVNATSVQPSAEPVLQAQPKQLDLLTTMPQSSAAPAETKRVASSTPDAVSVKKPVTSPEPQALPQLALEDACRILKVGVGETWEKVEASRRKIVTKSSPLATVGLHAAQVQKLMTDAQLANDAAVVVAARRCGRQ